MTMENKDLRTQYPGEYRAWVRAKRSCNELNLPCSPGLTSFEVFLKIVGPRPTPRCRLIRTETGNGLMAGNVFWKTLAPQHPPNPGVEYYAWQNAKSRFDSPKHKLYPKFGGAGLVLPPILETFDGFLNHVGPRPSPKHWLLLTPNSVSWVGDDARNYLTRQQPVPGLSNDAYMKLRAVAKSARVTPATLQKLILAGVMTLDQLLAAWDRLPEIDASTPG